MTQIATSAGLIDLRNPDATRLTPAMLASGLAKLNRWIGHTQSPLSVAQHSLMVANQLPRRARIYGLLHDAHEALIGDIATPVEQHLEHLLPGFRGLLSRVKADLDAAIRAALNVPAPNNLILAEVFEADSRMAATEWVSLIPDVNGRREESAVVPLDRLLTPNEMRQLEDRPQRPKLKPYPMRIKAQAWPAAESNYLMALTQELELKGWVA